MIFRDNMIRVLLSSSSEEGNSIEGDTGQMSGRGRFEFVAFILWYVAMIFFCIVPTCCAYRRRRRLIRQMHSRRRRSIEIFLQQQQEAAEAGGIEATTATMLGSTRNSNAFIWPEFPGAVYYTGNQVLTLETLDGEAASEERKRRLEIAIEDTTFVVKESNIIDLEKSDVKEENSNINDENTQTSRELKDDSEGCLEGEECIPDSKQTEEKDIEQGTALDIDESNFELRLPSSCLESSIVPKNSDEQSPNSHDEAVVGNKTVPGVCAICLCSYEVGDRVTYSDGVLASQSEQDIESGSSSTISQCPHAFHTDCIVQWLAKKNDARPECPCCRRPFCSVAPLTTADLLTLSPTNTRGRLRTTRTSGITSTATSRPGMRQIPMIALPMNSESGNGNDSGQRVMVLLPTSEMLSF